jgi:hypothetical protein
MSKIIKKSDITTLVESTMKQAGILREGEETFDLTTEADEVEVTVSDDGTEIKHGDKEVEIEDSEEVVEEDCDDTEEIIEMDVVAESTTKLAGQASEHNIISENLKKDLASFNKIINYKY